MDKKICLLNRYNIIYNDYYLLKKLFKFKTLTVYSYLNIFILIINELGFILSFKKIINNFLLLINYIFKINF